ncbi:hypothetical protein C4569_03885 [Candidatus Parcubacteria bacterium]|nr:MAG: hypothetical protein C4569_03885 [Candidatus Parcubacteria bacterium]
MESVAKNNHNNNNQKGKTLKVEILEKLAALATAGFGLVAALAWNQAIQGLFSKLFPQPSGNILAMFIYAVIITVFVVFITIYLGRAVNLAKQKIDNNPKKD